MFSSFSSSSSIPPQAPSQSHDQMMLASSVPLGRALSSLFSQGAGRRRQSNKKKIFSSIYPSLGQRPNARSSLKLTEYTCEMRIDYLAVLTSSTVANTYGAYAANLGQFNGTVAMLAAFDQYRINSLEIWFEPQSAYVSSANVGSLTTAVDIDDANVPTNVEMVANHQSAICSDGVTGHYHKFKPHMAINTYSGVFGAFANMPATWIDSASNTVQHYGLKFSCTPSTVAQVYNMSIRANVSFRQPGL